MMAQSVAVTQTRLAVIPDKTLADLGWPQLLAQLAKRCHTARGEDQARALPFLDDPERARERLARVTELRRLRDAAAEPPFGGIQDIRAMVARVDKGGDLEAAELIAVGETLAGCGKLQRHLVSRRELAPLLAALAGTMTDLSGDVAGPILDSFDDDGTLADHASERLGQLRRGAAKLQEQLVRRAKRLIDDPAIGAELQDKFYTQRDGRYVVPIRADAPSRIKGIVHGTSHSGATLFIEPESFVELNNGLKIAQSQIADEERRILAELSGYVREDAEPIRGTLARATEIDVLDASSRLADALRAIEPVLDCDGALLLRNARHPLMELSERTCVPNDIDLPPAKIMVVSGPNAGGKTVALKTIGLAALMVRAGLHVPAGEGSRVPWVRAVHTDIGDDQSLERDLSTFSAHVMHLKEMIEDAGPDALILIDEVAVGTAPEQGAALAQAALEAFADRGARAVVTTHYEPVKALAAMDGRFTSASVGFDMEAMEPTFRLHMGAPGSSGGLMVARRLGMPDAIVSRAEALLGEGRANIDELLAAAQRERERLAEQRAQVEALRSEAETERRVARDARRAAEEREQKLRKGAHGEAVDALRRARDELDRVRAGLRRRKVGAGGVDVGGADAERAAIDRLAKDVASHAPEPPEPEGAPPTADELTVGTPVIVAKLGGKGQVVEAPSGSKVTVQLGAMRTTVRIADVRLDTAPRPKPRSKSAAAPPPSKRNRNRKPQLVDGDDGKAPARTLDNTVDVRGERVDEALPRVDRFLDDCLLAMRDIVFIIHGHGTGALRNAVREQIKLHPVVQRWRPGEPDEGGDGITIAWLDV
jgi:DNA mismatch repair protein MutS2